MIAQGAIDLTHRGLCVVGLDLLDPLGSLDLSPEVPRVGDYSVMTVVGPGYNDGQHLALGPRQG